jgi:putative tryptophan/tyrosine transport system substrate-binding protein
MTVLSRGAAMRRREFITLIGGAAAAWPLGARAQQTSKVWRVGMLETTSATLNAVNVDAFRRGLRQLGYVEGQNLIIEYRSGEGRIDRFPELAAEMVRLKVDIIVTRGTPAALAAKNATATIPIVMAAIGEPVGTGMVLSRATRRERHRPERLRQRARRQAHRDYARNCSENLTNGDD